MKVIKTDLLCKTYDSLRALNRVSFSIKKGEATALIGENGSGKTTLINIILGFTASDGAPEGGSCTVLGNDSRKLTPNDRQQIGCISDSTSPMPWAKLEEVARFYRKIYLNWDDNHFKEMIERWKLNCGQRLNQMSKGQKRLAEFALTMSAKPQILFLDEPFNELDPQHRIDLAMIIREKCEQDDMTVFYSTHALTEIPSIADRLLMMKSGNLVLDSKIIDLNEDIPDTFLKYNR